MQSGGGISLQISEELTKIVLDQFLVEASVKSVGVLDTYLNNEDYEYLTLLEAVARPWHQNNPVKPIGFPEGFLKITDILMICPLDPDQQEKIQLMLGSERAVFYVGPFAIQGNLTMGADMQLSGAIEAVPKRFLTLTDVSFFPMFPATTTLPEAMPIALLNRSKISLYHAIE